MRGQKTLGKILVIDDEKSTLSMFRLFLRAYGYKVLTAEKGETGLDIFKKEKPSIVLTDIKMPEMDGLEVLKQIKEIDPRTEVIVITGHGDMALALEALNQNATDFINKPIQKSDLDSALKRAEERLKSVKGREVEISPRVVDDIGIIDVKGSINSNSEPILHDVYEKISAKSTGKVVMVFDERSSINNAGIAILIQLLSTSKKRDQRIAIAGLSEHFKKIFYIVGIPKMAKIFDHEKEAVDFFSNSG